MRSQMALIGAGGFGAWTAWRLRQAGHCVITSGRDEREHERGDEDVSEEAAGTAERESERNPERLGRPIGTSPAIAAHCWPARSRADCGLLLIPRGRSARGRRARHAPTGRPAGPRYRQRRAWVRGHPRLRSCKAA